MEQTLSKPRAPAVTICLPVYNVAPYLRACLASIFRQTFRDFAVLAVDDGSTDGSAGILREFAEKYPNLRVLHQENQGVAAARNRAISLVESEFLCLVDSDDRLAPTYLEELVKAARESRADIVCCYFWYRFLPSGRRVAHPLRCAGEFSREKALERLLHDWSLQSYPWNKLYRTRLFHAHAITFPNLRFFEDLATIPRLFFHAERVVVKNLLLYEYVQRDSGATKCVSLEKINDFLRAAAGLRVFLEQSGEYPRFASGYAALCRKTNLWCKLFLWDYHQKRGSLGDFLPDARRCSAALQVFQKPSFARKWAARPDGFSECLRLPAVLFMPDKNERGTFT